MSLFRYSDYIQASKKNKTISSKRASHGGIALGKKVKLPTQHRSPNHKCSLCTRKDAKKYFISTKDIRWLCINCVIKNQNKNTNEIPNFIAATKLKRKSEDG